MKHKGAAFAYHNSSDDITDYLLECMRQGKPNMIRDYAGEEQKKEMIERLFGNDRAFVLRGFMVIWIEAAKIADEIGLPSDIVDKTLEKCINKSQVATTPWMLSVVSEEYLVEFAEIIRTEMCLDQVSPIFHRFQRYVKAHISEPLEIEQIAQALNISKSHLSHTIKRETGVSVHQWIMEEKIQLAKILLLNKNMPMSEIWKRLGFCSQSHFAKCFRSFTGTLPSRYRIEMNK